MATNTTNYNLTKPDPTDFYDIGVTNANLDKIDTAIKTVENGVNAKTQVATTAEAQAGTNNSKVMTPLRVKEVANTKVSKTGDTMTGDLKINKPIPTLELNDSTIGSSYQIAYNRSASADYGIQFRKDGNPFMVVRNDKDIAFYDTDGSTFSIQSLKQGLVNGLSNIAAAVTSKGVTTASDANVSTIVNNINAIPSGKRIASGQVTRIDDYLYIPIPFTPSSIQYRGTNSGISIYDTGQYIRGGTLPGVSQDYSYFVSGNTGAQGAPRVSNSGGNYTIAHDTIRNSGINTFSWIAYE